MPQQDVFVVGVSDPCASKIPGEHAGEGGVVSQRRVLDKDPGTLSELGRAVSAQARASLGSLRIRKVKKRLVQNNMSWKEQKEPVGFVPCYLIQRVASVQLG